jgi:ketosteroid isomerase-like protein
LATDHDQLCRLAYARYSDGDFDAQLELFDPAVEVYVAPPNFESGTYRGHTEYRALIERWGAVWEEMRITVRRMEVVGDWILASVEYAGQGKGSALEVTQRSWELSRWQRGRCTRYEVYWNAEQGERAFAERTTA